MIFDLVNVLVFDDVENMWFYGERVRGRDVLEMSWCLLYFGIGNDIFCMFWILLMLKF